jgi:hypothetical protein
MFARWAGRPHHQIGQLGGVVVRQSRGVPDDGVDGGTRAVGVQHDNIVDQNFQVIGAND